MDTVSINDWLLFGNLIFSKCFWCVSDQSSVCVCGHSWWLKNHGHGFQQRVDQQPPGILPVLPMLTAAPGAHAGFWLSLSDHSFLVSVNHSFQSCPY